MKTDLVTGANRGIGLALVGALLDGGAAKVYATARRESDLAAAAKLDAERIVPVQLDVTNPVHLARVAGTAKDVAVLFNIAALERYGEAVIPLISAAGGEVVGRGRARQPSGDRRG